MPDALRGEEEPAKPLLLEPLLLPTPPLRPVEVLRGDDPEVLLKFSR